MKKDALVGGPFRTEDDTEEYLLEPERKRRSREEGPAEWVVTYGDLMTLLLCFFVLLFSMSELKVERFILATQSFSRSFGGASLIEPDDPTGLVEETQDTLRPELIFPEVGLTPMEREIISLAELRLEDIARQLEEFVRQTGLEELISVDRSEEGVHLRVVSSTLFASGSAEIIPEMRWVFARLVEVTSRIDVAAVISGHTDDTPIQTAQFPSNWELSAARAGGVARELAEVGHSPDLLRVEAFGEHRPLDTNATEEGRARNRRVEILYSRQALLAEAAELLQAESGGY